ncbi:hypothetical protein A2335_04690 [Candidatus Peregrinibacteria bacterium RIFOXYB2_FULL_32_7]|nr:MAG: hypothetical protein A2335_04690 [Candidatus Peregrinibacteria bacterium RIFOXYB2_FULL_32_7]
MCLSPVIALATALEGFAGIQSEIGGLGIKKFVDYAFIPVKVALVTTLGFLLIYQFNKITREDQVIDEQTVQQSSSESTILQTGDQVVDEQRAQQEQAEGGEKNTWALAESSEINLSGQYSSMRVMVKTAGVFSNFNDVRQIAFHLIIVVVLYKGIEWATKDTMTSAFTNRIWGAVKDWGTYIGKAPLHATTIPYYAGEGDEKGVSLFDAYETFLNPHQFEANQKAKKQQDQKVPLNERIQNIKNFNDANQLVKENPYQFLHSKDEGANRDKFAKELITRYEKGFTESGMSVTDINKLKALDYAHNDQGQMVALLAAVAALSNGQNVSDEYKKGAADLIETMNGNVKKEDIETWYNGKASQVNAEEERTKAIQADIKDKHNDLTIGNKEHFKDTFFQVAEGKGLEGMTADQKKDEANKIVQAIDNLGAELSDAEITALNKIAEGDVKKVVPTLEMMKTMLDSSKAGDKLSGPAYDNAKTVFTAAHEASAGASHIQNTVAKTEIEMTRAETACQQQGAKAIEEDDGSGKKIKKIEYKNKDGVTIKVVLPAGKKTEADGDHLKLVDEAPAATGGS